MAVFPAHAGVIPAQAEANYFISSFSRTRGGDPAFWKPLLIKLAFFPHTRG